MLRTLYLSFDPTRVARTGEPGFLVPANLEQAATGTLIDYEPHHQDVAGERGKDCSFHTPAEMLRTSSRQLPGIATSNLQVSK